MPYNKQIGPIDNDLRNFAWYPLLPDYRLPKSQVNHNKFWATMFERQEVWYRRHILQQAQPWTADPILRDYKFTNVYRQLDRSSTWLINNVLKKEQVFNSPHNVIWQIIAYRLFNKPDAFLDGVELPTHMGYCNKGTQERFAQQMHDWTVKNGNAFTSSFYINCTNCDGLPKLDCYTRRELPRIHALIPQIAQAITQAEQRRDPHHLIKALTQLPRVSHFNAHEFYQDFCYHRTYAPLGSRVVTTFTQRDYTNVGPGASVGLRLLFPNTQTKEAQVAHIHQLQEQSSEALERFGKFKYTHYSKITEKHVYKDVPNLTLHQVEMWLCEYQKYWKMEHKLGRQRSKFTPHE